ncbi:outer membrane lipoprotein-sorting protein [bacterium]|nr:outer membrane lipoprotein-sorting protein [bacterium]
MKLLRYSHMLVLILCVHIPGTASAEKSALDWLNALDRNQVMESAKYTAVMTVHLPSGQERVFKMKGHVVGDQYALMEYLEPPRDAGTRYLRRDDQLWIYFPRVDRTMLVQGHMLREGVQGSDMSYEDMTQSSSWADKYNATITAETDSTVEIRMEAKDMTVSYPFREITIDKARNVATRVLNFDASQYPVKEMSVEKIQQFGARWFATSTMIRSHITVDKWTRFEITGIEFDVPYSEDDFTKAALERTADF